MGSAAAAVGQGWLGTRASRKRASLAFWQSPAPVQMAPPHEPGCRAQVCQSGVLIPRKVTVVHSATATRLPRLYTVPPPVLGGHTPVTILSRNTL